MEPLLLGVSVVYAFFAVLIPIVQAIWHTGARQAKDNAQRMMTEDLIEQFKRQSRQQVEQLEQQNKQQLVEIIKNKCRYCNQSLTQADNCSHCGAPTK